METNRRFLSVLILSSFEISGVLDFLVKPTWTQIPEYSRQFHWKSMCILQVAWEEESSRNIFLFSFRHIMPNYSESIILLLLHGLLKWWTEKNTSICTWDQTPCVGPFFVYARKQKRDRCFSVSLSSNFFGVETSVPLIQKLRCFSSSRLKKKGWQMFGNGLSWIWAGAPCNSENKWNLKQSASWRLKKKKLSDCSRRHSLSHYS